MNWTIFQRILKRLYRVLGKKRRYASISLSSGGIARGDYKHFLGGGTEEWESRGRFQLDFLLHAGLRPDHMFLDVGCGPLRAGEHLIRYLEVGHYIGMDYNTDFLRAAELLIAQQAELASRCPRLIFSQNFDAGGGGHKSFDIILAFSVLNHCTPSERLLFWQVAPKYMHDRTRLFISHAGWLDDTQLQSVGLTVAQRYEKADQLLPPGRALHCYGWRHGEEKKLLPILELAKATGASSERGTG